MGLAHAWRRQGMWATAVTLVVPAALAVAVATALLGSGLRSLGVLGQIVTGPKVPEAQLSAGRSHARHAARLPAVPAARPFAARPAPAAGPGVAPAARGPRGTAPLATAPPRRPAASGPAPAAGASPAPAQGAPPPAPPSH